MAAAILPGQRLAIEREIEGVKFEGELRLLEIQAEHARMGGLEDVATAIDAEVESLRERRVELERTQSPVQE